MPGSERKAPSKVLLTGIANENRLQSRGNVLHAGICVLDGGTSKVSCSIRELSNDGMRITFVLPQQLPSRIWIINISKTLAYQAKVVWNIGSEVGLSIIVKQALDDIRDPTLKFLRGIWLDRVLR